MRQLIKIFLCIVFLVSGLEASWGFALIGPTGNNPNPGNFGTGDAWQLPTIGYGLLYESFNELGGPVLLGDIGAAKNLGEEYRRNVPVVYYAYDANWLGFFGSNGIVAADSAFAIMNSLTNVDSYSAGLTEFPLQAMQINNEASALFLTDVKSVTLHLLVEQMGLAEPEHYTWTLHDRFLPPSGKCPFDEIYLVVQRNFDIVSSPLNQIQYSPYVNGVLYTYSIEEACTGPNPLAFTVTSHVDPTLEQYTAVAANNFDTFGGLQIGHYYTGLTRDDVAGLRYLMTTNNINTETAEPGALLETTNLASTNVIQNLDLSVLLASAFTNDPVTLAGLFPNLIITSVTTNFQTVCTPNIVSTIKNNTGAPLGSPPIFVITTNGFNCVFQQVYTYSFGNVITNGFSAKTSAKLVTISVGQRVGAPAGSLATNITTKSITLTNPPSGSYFLIPPGACGLSINFNTGITSGITTTTNVLTTATNANGFVDSQSVVTSFTNRQFLGQLVICGSVAASTGSYQGIKKVQFVKANFDSLISQFFQPVTNNYTMTVLTNSQFQIQHFQRVATQPDILFTANDQGQANTFNGTVFRSINFDQGNALVGLAGPGVINAPSIFDFNKIGAVFFNGLFPDTNSFVFPSAVNQTTQIQLLTWASFDGSTNEPVVYPYGTSIDNLGNMVFVQVSPPPPVLPTGTKGVAYSAITFTATGGSFSPPFTWSVSAGLSPGLAFSSGGTLSGTPTQSGIFDFNVQLTDSLSRSVQWTYTITIQ